MPANLRDRALALQAALQRAWNHRGPMSWLLRPLSWLYGGLSGLRRQLYRAGWLRVQQLARPVVVVGNVLAGGTGKTPVVMALVEHLQSAGLACGVISRGWGRLTRDCREVKATSTAAEVGDEPLLVARRCGVPVFVASRRVEAGRALLARYPQVQVLISDDGLQHLAMARDLEMVVFDGRGTGNGLLLPAGPLREPWPRRADLVLRPAGVAIDGFEVSRRLAPYAVQADGTRCALTDLAGPGLVAVAAIGRPEVFFDMLRAAGVQARTLALPDHDALDPESLQLEPGERLVCTEKDAVKLWGHRPQAWAVPLLLEIEPAFWRQLDRLLGPKLSSADGFETA